MSSTWLLSSTLFLYFNRICHYFPNGLTVFTITVLFICWLFLLFMTREKFGDRVITPMGTIQRLLDGLGFLQTIPLFAALWVEWDWWNSLRDIASVFMIGGPLHLMFHIQTKTYYMIHTILVGGAKYRVICREFFTQHTPCLLYTSQSPLD